MSELKEWIEKAWQLEKNDKALIIEGPQGSGKSVVTRAFIKFGLFDAADYNPHRLFNSYRLADLIICQEIAPKLSDLNEMIAQDGFELLEKGEPPSMVYNYSNWIIETLDASEYRQDHIVATPLQFLATLTGALNV